MACCHQCPCCQKNIVVDQIDEHKNKCDPDHVLSVELDYFEQHRKEWFEYHAGKIALVYKTTVHDFYDSYKNALIAGYEKYGNIPFLLKEVQLVDEVFFLPSNMWWD